MLNKIFSDNMHDGDKSAMTPDAWFRKLVVRLGHSEEDIIYIDEDDDNIPDYRIAPQIRGKTGDVYASCEELRAASAWALDKYKDAFLELARYDFD